MYFLVKVRVDISRMAEFGKRIANHEFDNTSIKSTFCLKNDPTIGYSVWETKDETEFEKKFTPYRSYYNEVEIFTVVLPNEAQELIMKQFVR